MGVYIPMKGLYYALLFLAVFCCSSCARILLGTSGKSKPLDDAAIVRYARKYALPATRILDSNYYISTKTLHKDKDVKKSLIQPLQFWLYQGDSLEYAMVNCYADYKFPNLVWPLDSVNATTSPMKVQDFLTYNEHLNVLGDVSREGQDPKLIVVWSKFLGRQNRHFLKKVHKYLENNPRVQVTYYNGDNIYSGRGL